MTTALDRQTLEFDEPTGVGPRGTLVVLPGRGDTPSVYHRFGARIAVDAYKVRVVADQQAARAVLTESLAPVILVGIDTGALEALDLVQNQGAEVAGLVLVGLPDASEEGPTEWDEELAARASCPTQQARLADTSILERGQLTAANVAEHLRTVTLDTDLPVLALHGQDDAVSPLTQARARYAGARNARVLSVAQGRHDVLNSLNHRSVAASVVVFLESLKAGAELVHQENVE